MLAALDAVPALGQFIYKPKPLPGDPNADIKAKTARLKAEQDRLQAEEDLYNQKQATLNKKKEVNALGNSGPPTTGAYRMGGAPEADMLSRSIEQANTNDKTAKSLLEEQNQHAMTQAALDNTKQQLEDAKQKLEKAQKDLEAAKSK